MGTADAECRSSQLRPQRYQMFSGLKDVVPLGILLTDTVCDSGLCCCVSCYANAVCPALFIPFGVGSPVACLTYCREWYRPTYHLHGSFNFKKKKNPLTTFPAVGYRVRKT